MATKTTVEIEPGVVAETSPLNIYQIVSRISAEAGALAPVQTSGVPFPFRGIDGTVNHLAPFLSKYGVVTVPTVIEHEVSAREVGNKVVKTAKILADFTFYAPDGTSITATTAGLADDYSDRCSAQAQSVAFRVALLQTFTLPTQNNEEAASQAVIDQTEKELGAATAPAKVKEPSAKEKSINAVRAEISAIIADEKNKWDGLAVNELGRELTGKTDAEWGGNVADLNTLLKELQDRLAKTTEGK